LLQWGARNLVPLIGYHSLISAHDIPVFYHLATRPFSAYWSEEISNVHFCGCTALE